MTIKNILAAVLATFAVLSAAAPAMAQRTTVVLIDRQKVVTDSAAFKSIQSQLTAIRTQVQTDLERKEASLTQGLQALQQTRETLSKEDFQQRAAALTRQEIDLLAQQEVANRELQIAQQNALNQLEEPLKAAVEAVAKKKKGALVLEKTMVVFPGNAADVTTDVLNELNKKISTVQVVKPTTSAEDLAKVRAQLEQQIALQQMEAVGRRQVLALGQQSIQAAAQQ
ncbi:MAG: OmpH family outer membrane protein [Pseudomonadota bacterium]